MPIYRTMTTILDAIATKGLLGVANSISYLIAEIDRHHHHWERWYGKASVPNAEIHVADRIGSDAGAFQIDAGNDDWGAWVQVLGSSDTPSALPAGNVKFDFHRIDISATERTQPYYIQVAAGASGAAALAAGTFSDLVFCPISATIDGAPISLGMRRQSSGTKVWVRCKCRGQNTGTMDFFVGIHEYEG